MKPKLNGLASRKFENLKLPFSWGKANGNLIDAAGGEHNSKNDRNSRLRPLRGRTPHGSRDGNSRCHPTSGARHGPKSAAPTPGGE